MMRALESPSYCVFLAIVALTLVFSISQTSQASEPDYQSPGAAFNQSHRKSENNGAGVLLGLFLACRLNAVSAALFEGRWWTWCGERRGARADDAADSIRKERKKPFDMNDNPLAVAP